MKLSEKIIYLRKEKGWSQEQLAIKLEVSRQAVYKWEADINQPDLDKLKRVANLFNVSYDILMDDTIDLPLTPNIVEATNEDEPKVEVLDQAVAAPMDTKTVHNEVAVQINYGKDSAKPSNKKLVAMLCVSVSVVVISLCVLSYILFGIVLQKDSYLVKFDTQGGTAVSDQVIKEGKEINGFVSPTKDGYTFDGWYLGDKKWDFDKDTIKGNTTLFAKWTPNKNTITYINQETGERYESYANTDEAVTLASNTFTKDGYIFMGWATSPSGEAVYSNCDTYKMGTENITLYAVWSPDHYNLVLNLGGGKLSVSVPSSFSSSESIALPTPVLEFYNFDGWYDNNNNKVDIIAKGTTSDVVLTAKYTPIEYTISYVLNGGKNNSENPDTYNAGTITTFLSPERQDYSFNGWYLDADFNTPVSKTTLGKGGNITLYASWELSSFSFQLVTGGYSVIGYSGLNTIVTIPKEYNGVQIVEIGENAFLENENITEIIIPNTVTAIDVTAFEGCASLTAITVEGGNVRYCSDNGILYNPDKTTLYKYPMGKEDTVYIAPDSLNVIGKHAFSYAVFLEEVYLPNDALGLSGVGKISAYAFDGCISLTTIEPGYLLNYVESYAFQNCWSLESIEFKASVVYGIERSAFENCFLLSDVTFAGKINAINDRAFYNCYSLASIDLNELTSLGSYVFQNTGLSTIFIPATVTATGSAIFFGCEKITVSCEAASRPNGWATDWDTGVDKVVWNVDYDGSINEFMYDEYEDCIIITGYMGASGTVVIPDYIKGKPVTEIIQGVFSYRDDISAINIPSTVTYIDMKTFDNCTSLAEINVDTQNTAYASRDGVLYNKNYTCLFKYPMGKQNISFTADKELDVIGQGAFKDNVHLQKLYLYEDSTLVYGVGKIYPNAFENCTGLTTVRFGYLTNYFDNSCFKNCQSIKTLEFNCARITGIELSAFEGCTSLESVAFLGTVDYIKADAFSGCTKLSSVDLGQTKQIYGYAFGNTALKEIFIPSSVNTIASYAFSGNKGLVAYCEAFSKPSGWSNEWNEGISQVYWGRVGLPGQARFTYGENGSDLSILYCEGAGVITLPGYDSNGKRITKIGANAFDGQNGITEIIIPVTITSIDLAAFDNCPSLEKITYLGTYTEFRSINGVLYGDYGRSIVKYPEGKTDSEFTVPTNVDIIRQYAFKNNTHLTKITLPSDVEGDNYVGKLEQGAFSGCTSLKAVEGCYVNYFDKEVFKDCTALKEITFYADDVWSIGNNSFLNCTSLESVTFKGNMHEIGYQVFGYCTKLSSVVFEGALDKLSMHAFENCISLESITLPKGLTTMISEAFKGCINLTSINIPSTVTKIEDKAFLGTGIKEIFIPVTVTEIEEYAFYALIDFTIYCEAAEKPSGYSDNWNAVSEADDTEYHTVLWGQDGENDIVYEFTKNDEGTYTLKECRGSGAAIIPEYYSGIAVTEIGENAFKAQSNIVLIRIPVTVKKIASNAFNLCYDLEKIEVDSNNTEFSSSDGILYNKDKTTLLRYPMNKSDEALTTPNKVTVISDYAFFGLNNLKRITFSGDITKIGYESFGSVASLNEITFNGKLTELNEKSFYWCAQLKSIDLPEGLTEIPAYAFSNCYHLTSVTIPSTVTKIGAHAFENIKSLSIFIPSTVTEIGENIFIDSENVTIYCEATEKPDGWNEKWCLSSSDDDATSHTVVWGQSGLPTN